MADTKQWEDNNGVFRYYKDEEAREAIETLNGDSSVQGSVAYQIAQALANFGAFQIVPSLESVTNPDGRVIYLVKDSTVTGDDKYAEYIYTDGAFAKIGETSLDLSNYVQFNNLASANNAGVVKIDGVTMEIDANGNISAKTVNGFTILSNVPANAVFTDTCNLSNATNILAITNGGTNASTVAGARTNLGLGSAATKGSTGSITANSTDLIESGAVAAALGSTDISSIGDGTVKGAIGSLNSEMTNIGKTTQLATVNQTDGTITATLADSLANYRAITIEALNYHGALITSYYVPVEVVRTHNGATYPIAIDFRYDSKDYRLYAKYVTDTSLEIATGYESMIIRGVI